MEQKQYRTTWAYVNLPHQIHEGGMELVRREVPEMEAVLKNFPVKKVVVEFEVGGSFTLEVID